MPIARELLALINERIERKREKLIGEALSGPYLAELGGQSVWVVDVLIYSDSEVVESVPMAESGRAVRDFINERTPLELQRSNAGQFYVVALSDKKMAPITKKTYSRLSSGFGFVGGWRRNASGDIETGNGNENRYPYITHASHFSKCHHLFC